jgi:hypothetical protein
LSLFIFSSIGKYIKKLRLNIIFVYTLFYVYQKFSGFARTALGMAAATKVKYPEKLVLCVGGSIGNK